MEGDPAKNEVPKEEEEEAEGEVIEPEGGTNEGGKVVEEQEGRKERPYVDHTYRDYSRYNGPIPKHKKSGKNFPAKLHALLSEPRLAHIITWMPHGRAWKILDKRLFLSTAIRAYFGQSKFEHFTRQLSGWGFKRLHRPGADCGAYYHQYFLRGLPHLTSLMRRAPTNQGRQRARPESEPNFFQISSAYPLPATSAQDDSTSFAQVASQLATAAAAASSAQIPLLNSYLHTIQPAQAQGMSALAGPGAAHLLAGLTGVQHGGLAAGPLQAPVPASVASSAAHIPLLTSYLQMIQSSQGQTQGAAMGIDPSVALLAGLNSGHHAGLASGQTYASAPASAPALAQGVVTKASPSARPEAGLASTQPSGGVSGQQPASEPLPALPAPQYISPFMLGAPVSDSNPTESSSGPENPSQGIGNAPLLSNAQAAALIHQHPSLALTDSAPTSAATSNLTASSAFSAMAVAAAGPQPAPIAAQEVLCLPAQNNVASLPDHPASSEADALQKYYLLAQAQNSQTVHNEGPAFATNTEQPVPRMSQGQTARGEGGSSDDSFEDEFATFLKSHM